MFITLLLPRSSYLRPVKLFLSASSLNNSWISAKFHTPAGLSFFFCHLEANIYSCTWYKDRSHAKSLTSTCRHRKPHYTQSFCFFICILPVTPTQGQTMTNPLLWSRISTGGPTLIMWQLVFLTRPGWVNDLGEMRSQWSQWKFSSLTYTRFPPLAKTQTSQTVGWFGQHTLDMEF